MDDIKQKLLKHRNELSGLVETYCGKECINYYRPCPFLDDSESPYTCTLPDFIADLLTMTKGWE